MLSEATLKPQSAARVQQKSQAKQKIMFFFL
jgi:hypothetical protein